MTITAPETNAEGIAFSHRADAEGNSIADTANCSIEIGTQNVTYTAVYQTVTYSEGLAFTGRENGTCYVSGIGACTDTNISIPSVSPEGALVYKHRQLCVRRLQ